MMEPYFIGIDVGTQGARVVLMDAAGNLAGSHEMDFPLNEHSREEQPPEEWWDACFQSLKKIINEVKGRIDLSQVKAVSVTSTSGTVIPLDSENKPLYNAIMYSDPRSAEEGKLCKAAALEFYNQGYTAFNASSGLSKMIWFVKNFPEKASRISKWIHAADFIIGKLSGRYDITDYTNALKSGYDVKGEKWPSYIHEKLPLKKEWLQQVVPSGTPIGTLETALAEELGLSPSVQVAAGMTDGCASQAASGAVDPGDWNTTIGTTLVVKGVTKKEIKDPEGRLYSHRHPEGFWMPGGASNTGADWVSADFSDDLESLNQQAEALIPTGFLAYPLRRKGERFPFIAPQAAGFEPKEIAKEQLFAANMEGVAYIERYAFEIIEKLSGEKVRAVYTAGGGSNSDTWLKIRSNVLNLPIYKMRYISGAAGAAILAASKTYFTSLIEAGRAMTQVEKEVYPDKDLTEKYDLLYKKFVNELLKRGYIREENYA